MTLKSDWQKTKFGTRAIHSGQPPEAQTGAIMTPIFQTSTFVQPSPGVVKDGYDYARSANPTRTALEANLASLENGKHGICFSSGCAALSAVLQHLNQGDHVVLADDVYGGTFRLLNNVFVHHGIEFTTVDMTDESAYQDAFNKNTKLVWLETPSNPLLKCVDIEKASGIAKKHGALMAVDNTFATPYLQNPLDLGADLVCHSATKYLGGHSDVIGGVLITNSHELAEKLHYIQNAVGAIPAPLDCFLLLRSTKTLHVRMERHCDNAEAIATMLEEHNKVERISYPGLSSHGQHQVAKKQMKRFGGMITVTLKGGLQASKTFLERVSVFSLAESLGGVESLIEHPAIMTHASIPKAQREQLGIDDGLVRLSVGIEDIDDLRDDLNQALDAV